MKIVEKIWHLPVDEVLNHSGRFLEVEIARANKRKHNDWGLKTRKYALANASGNAREAFWPVNYIYSIAVNA